MATTGKPLAGAVRKKASAQDDARTALRAAAARRAAADEEQRAAVQALHELALAVHAEGDLVPVKEILAITGLKESWFYQLRAKALKAGQEQQ